jgi:hypothetical protein
MSDIDTTLDTILDLAGFQIYPYEAKINRDEAKQALTAYLEAMTRAARISEQRFTIEIVENTQKANKLGDMNVISLGEIKKKARQRIAALTATTLQETPQGASDGLSEPAQPKDSKSITGETK